MERKYHYPDGFRLDIYRMIPPDGEVIGSIGCGRGGTEVELVEEGRQVHGVDISEEAIAVARTRLSSARVIDPDTLYPFEPGSLDGLILADVIEHLPTAWEALKHYAQMVKPGGWVVISVPNMRYFGALITFVVKGDWPELPMGIFDSTHIQVMTHKRLARWCANAGLKLDKEYDNYLGPFVRRNFHRAINLASFRLLKGFMNFEIQARYRKV